MIRRSVAITLGIVCILSVAGLGGALAYYTSITNDKDNTIASLNAQIASLNSQLSDENNTISSLTAQLATSQEQNGNIRILGTENSTVWVDNQTTAYGGQGWLFYNVSPAAYLSFLVSSNNNST